LAVRLHYDVDFKVIPQHQSDNRVGVVEGIQAITEDFPVR